MADNVEKDQKTEEATPRRREEAREKGQVAQSKELVAALMLCSGLGAIVLGGGRLASEAGDMVRAFVAQVALAQQLDFSPEAASAQFKQALGSMVGPLMAVFLPAVAIGALVGYGQVGFRVTPKAVETDLTKLNPVKGLERLFSMRSFFRTGMSLAKIAAIALTMTVIAWTQIPGVIELSGSELGPLLVGIGHVALRCTGGALVAILVLALADFFYQRFQHDKDLRMSKQEIREEHKATEGDPKLKGRVRAIQRELAQRRMMADVPKATVVVTNPTHFAVALRYERDAEGAARTAAPVVVAKGVDQVAERIKQVAREAGVTLYEDVQLARALWRQAEIGDLIPEELYGAVAVVIRYVWQVEGKELAAARG